MRITPEKEKGWADARQIVQGLLSVLLFAMIYFPWFLHLEATVVPVYWIYAPLDDSIPFLPQFIVFYLLWFPFVLFFVAYFLLRQPDIFRRLAVFLGVGMLLCLLVYTVFPNGQALRPDIPSANTVWLQMVRRLYRQDTPTNVCPSIHTYNTIGVQIALLRTPRLKGRWWVQLPCHVLAVLIIASTVVLKQHSIVDVFAAAALAIVLYPLTWGRASSFLWRTRKA